MRKVKKVKKKMMDGGDVDEVDDDGWNDAAAESWPSVLVSRGQWHCCRHHCCHTCSNRTKN